MPDSNCRVLRREGGRGREGGEREGETTNSTSCGFSTGPASFLVLFKLINHKRQLAIYICREETVTSFNTRVGAGDLLLSLPTAMHSYMVTL